MLGLKLPTDPRWVEIAKMNIEDILVDHAYCEQKAASSGISMIVQYPEKEELVKVMTDLVEEEWEHFRRVLDELKKRGYKLGRQRKDEYANELLNHIRKGVGAEKALMDKLLVNGLIEARSCERFRLLSQEVDDPELASFYHELMASEAGHYRTFLDLAKTYSPEEEVKARWQELLDIEAEILQRLAVRDDRMH